MNREIVKEMNIDLMYRLCSKLLNSIIDRFHREVQLDNCLSMIKYSNMNNYQSIDEKSNENFK